MWSPPLGLLCVPRESTEQGSVGPLSHTRAPPSHRLPDLIRAPFASEMKKPLNTNSFPFFLCVPGRWLEETRNYLLTWISIRRKRCHFPASGTTGGLQVKDARGVAWGPCRPSGLPTRAVHVIAPYSTSSPPPSIRCR